VSQSLTQPPPAATAASALLAKPNVADRAARSVVFGIFRKFTQGCLHVTSPDGSVANFGDPSAIGPIASLTIHDHACFRKVLLFGEVGFGEAYMDGDWSSPDVPALIQLLLANLNAIPGMSGGSANAWLFDLLGRFNRVMHWLRRNTRSNSKRNIREHYDLSNDFYALWLDETWTYSSAWFESPNQSLADAQNAKYRRLARKLKLEPGMHVLEIGCGWGGFSILAAREFGVRVTAVTISDAQFQLARQRVAAAGLESQIDVILKDYRDLTGQFDAIVSIEMLEAVGHQFLTAFFSQCHQLLAPHGRVGLQVIVCPDARYDQMRRSVDWIKRHIFPGGQLPSLSAMQNALLRTGDLYVHHLESFGLHYAQTLALWRQQFAARREAVAQLGFDERFLRKWHFYLCYCEAAFAARNINVSQLILSRPNNTAFASELV
jgi:cyclopropane-fatty-acyl-phospholipid synthase